MATGIGSNYKVTVGLAGLSGDANNVSVIQKDLDKISEQLKINVKLNVDSVSDEEITNLKEKIESVQNIDPKVELEQVNKFKTELTDIKDIADKIKINVNTKSLEETFKNVGSSLTKSLEKTIEILNASLSQLGKGTNAAEQKVVSQSNSATAQINANQKSAAALKARLTAESNDLDMAAVNSQLKATSNLTATQMKDYKTVASTRNSLASQLEAANKAASQSGALGSNYYTATQVSIQKALDTLIRFENSIKKGGSLSKTDNSFLSAQLADVKTYVDLMKSQAAQIAANDKASETAAKNELTRVNTLAQNKKQLIELERTLTATQSKTKVSDRESGYKLTNEATYMSEYQKVTAALNAAKTKVTNGTPLTKTEQLQLNTLIAKYKTATQAVETYKAKVYSESGEAFRYQNLSNSMSMYFDMFGTQIKKNSVLLREWGKLVNTVANKKLGTRELQQEFANFRVTAKAAGAEVENFGTKLSRTIGSRLRSLMAGQLFFSLMTATMGLVSNVKDIDIAMTELRKVTNNTAAEYNQFLDDASGRAEKLGSTLVNVISSSADFARLGYNISDASKLADTAITYLNVGDEVESIDEATKSVISTMEAFDISADKSMTIIDKFNEVSNNFPTSAGAIGAGLERSAAALDAAGNSIDESIALFTAGQSVVQNADTMGNVLKSSSMRIRGAKTDLEEAGESTEGMASSTSKLRDELMSLTGGFDIMKEGGKTFKSTYEILQGISKVWSKMSDVSQANVLEMLAGRLLPECVETCIKNSI